MTKHEKEGQLGEECGCDIHSSCSIHSEEKKDWKDGMSEGKMSQVWCRLNDNEIEILKDFISEKLKEEREKVEKFYMNQTANEHDNLIREALLKEILDKVDDVDVVGNPEGELVVVEIQELIRKKMV